MTATLEFKAKNIDRAVEKASANWEDIADKDPAELQQ